MNGNVGIVEGHFMTILLEREVVLVNLGNAAISKVYVPIVLFHVDHIHVITFFIEERVQTLC